MRKAGLIRENERLRCRIAELENVICPAEQHDFVEARKWFVPCGTATSPTDVEVHRRMICKRCFVKKVVNDLETL